MSLGYTLCFAVILAKTWRVYHIFTNPTPKKTVRTVWSLCSWGNTIWNNSYKSWRLLASSPGHSQILFHSRGEKAWDQNYVTDRKWWTLLVQTEPTLRTNRVHHFREKAWDQNYVTDQKWWTRFVLTEPGPRCSFDPRPSPDFSRRLRDKIWEWPGDEARRLLWVIRVGNFIFVDSQRLVPGSDSAGDSRVGLGDHLDWHCCTSLSSHCNSCSWCPTLNNSGRKHLTTVDIST